MKLFDKLKSIIKTIISITSVISIKSIISIISVISFKSVISLFICNWIATTGTILTTLTAIANILYFIGELRGIHYNVYIGAAFGWGIGPFYLFGVVIVFAGIVFEFIKHWYKDPNLFRHQVRYVFTEVFGIKYVSPVIVGMMIFLLPAVPLTLIILAGSYEYMETIQFCGEFCHKLMTPEYEAYLRSPHSHIRCTHCHIGGGLMPYIKAKINGLREMVMYVMNTYPRPLKLPLIHMRPAHDICAHCHNPNKYHGRKMKVYEHFLPDRENTKIYNVVLLNVGGPEPWGRDHPSIHWHVNEGSHVSFKSENDDREIITWVKLEKEGEEPVEYYFSGKKQTFEDLFKTSEHYSSKENKKSETKHKKIENSHKEENDTHGDTHRDTHIKNEKTHEKPVNSHGKHEKKHGEEHGKKHGKKDKHVGGHGDGTRVMDCYDCHNRPTHIFQSAQEAIENILIHEPEFQKIPFIKKIGLQTILTKFSEEDIQNRKVEKTIFDWYAKNQKTTGKIDKLLIKRVAEEIQTVHRLNVWPELKLEWSTFPDHRGHTQSNGCIRCHDNNHRTKEGKAINADCNLCHEIVCIQEKNPDILKEINWLHKDTISVSLQEDTIPFYFGR